MPSEHVCYSLYMLRNIVKIMSYFVEIVFKYDYLLFGYNTKTLIKSDLLNYTTKQKKTIIPANR